MISESGVRGRNPVVRSSFDTSGTRLGQGRGYYDRALQVLGDGVPVLALVHDEEVLDPTTPVPRDPHDVAVHGAITPTRWMFFGRF